MELFFDILLYISFFVSIPLFIIGVKRFPSWVAKIDPAKCKSGKPIERYLEGRLLLQEGKIALMVLPCAAVSILSTLLGSTQQMGGDDGSLFGILLLLDFIISVVGGLFLGRYFLKTAMKFGVYQKTNNSATASVRTIGNLGIGMLICFYFSGIMMFTLWHLFCILGVG